MIPPATRKLALRAARLARYGNKGAFIAKKLGLANAREANALKSHGFLIERDERSKLTAAELLCIRLIDIANLRHTEAGITSGVRAPQIDRMASRAQGWCARTVERRLRTKHRDEDYLESPAMELVRHSRNGHVWLTPAGRALAHVLRDVPPHILRKWGVRT